MKKIVAVLVMAVILNTSAVMYAAFYDVDQSLFNNGIESETSEVSSSLSDEESDVLSEEVSNVESEILSESEQTSEVVVDDAKISVSSAEVVITYAPLDNNGILTELKVSAIDGDGTDLSENVTVVSTGGYNSIAPVVGDYQVQLGVAGSNGNFVEESAVLTIIPDPELEIIDVVIEAQDATTIQSNAPKSTLELANLLGASATDSDGSDASDKILYSNSDYDLSNPQVGEYEYTLSVTGLNGNTVATTVTLTVESDPVVTVGDATITAVSSSVKLVNAPKNETDLKNVLNVIALEENGDDITNDVKITDQDGYSFDNPVPGSYNITFSVVDVNGNLQTITATLTVEDGWNMSVEDACGDTRSRYFGEIEVETETYNTDCKLTMKLNFSDNGVIEKATTYYVENGNKKKESIYVNGKKDFENYYSSNGQLDYVQAYKNDVLYSKIVYENDKKLFAEYYTSGNIYKKVEYYTDGKTKKIFIYHSNKKVKTLSQYYTNGKTKQYTAYSTKGVITSNKYYYTNGKYKQIKTYYSTGVVKSNTDYYTNGVKKVVTQYSTKKKITYRKYYYTNGKAKQSNKYHANGKLSALIKYNSKGIKTSYITYSKYGKKASSSTFHANGKYKTYTGYVHSGAATIRKEFNSFGSITKYSIYRTNGKLKQVKTYYGNKKYKSIFEYDNKGRIKTKVYYNTNGKRRLVQKYNTKGKLIATENYNNGVLITNSSSTSSSSSNSSSNSSSSNSSSSSNTSSNNKSSSSSSSSNSQIDDAFNNLFG